jgi:hypothetical protein
MNCLKLVSSIVAASLLITPLSAADLNVRHIRALDRSDSQKGAFFALPKTVVTASVTLELSKFKPGKFVDLAPVFFPELFPDKFEDYEKLKSERQSIKVKDATLAAKGAPDPEYVFWIDLKSRLFLERAVVLSLTESGAVTSLSASADNTLPDFIMSVVSAATGIATRAFIGGFGTSCVAHGGKSREEWFLGLQSGDTGWKSSFQQLRIKLQGTSAFTVFDDLVKKDVVDCETSTPPKQQGFQIKLDSPLSQALELRNSHKELKTNRTSYKSEYRGDVKAFQEAIDQDLKAITGNFYGTSEATEWVAPFEIVLTNNAIGRDFPLIQLNEDASKFCLDTKLWKGFKLPKPSFFASTNEYDCGKVTISRLQPVSLKLTPIPGLFMNQIRASAKEYKIDAAGQGLPYRVPEINDVKVVYTPNEGLPNTLARQEMAIAQFGFVTSLPKSLGSKKTKALLGYHESSGALKNLDTTGTPVSGKSVVDSLSGNVNSILDAESKAALAARTAADPLTKLQRERQLLEEKVKIKLACEALKLENCSPMP